MTSVPQATVNQESAYHPAQFPNNLVSTQLAAIVKPTAIASQVYAALPISANRISLVMMIQHIAL
jgi:hypothetical protein